MKMLELTHALDCAVDAAQAAGKLMRRNAHLAKKINEASQHDLKLELDVRCQHLIERSLRGVFPDSAILGEEGVLGDRAARCRWVVDPIDGTVNFAYGIPHACVSIALQVRAGSSAGPAPHTISDASLRGPDYTTVVGVVYDPFCDELWTAIRGRRARLNGGIIQVSKRRRLEEAVVSLGFAKSRAALIRMLPAFERLVHRVRKIRMMGSAALSLAYVASGRFDAFVEYGLRLWDIAAGGLILECARGDFWHQPIAGDLTYHVVANNGFLRRRFLWIR
jgi:myo-inositol-1(or 4)-monophosphatase